jgi:hypothetical protein
MMLLPLITLALAPALPIAPQTTQTDSMGVEAGTAHFNYTYGEFDVCFVDPDYSGSDTEIGFQLLGSARVYRDLFVRASYLDSGGDADLSLLKFGAGWAFPIQPQLDVYGLFQIAQVDVADNDDTGWVLESGVRYAATEQFELNGLLEIVDFDDAELGVGVGGRYSFTPKLSAGLNFETISDFADIVYVGLRYQF